jgi:UDP-N-acetylmuramoyl-tripeptide--D-alanyl-D-alanine ligase
MLTLEIILEALLPKGGTPPGQPNMAGRPGLDASRQAESHSEAAGIGRVITEACIDSRHAIPGSLFVALPGEHVDGHDFVEDAFRRGAQCALVQKDMAGDYPTLDLRPQVGMSPEQAWTALQTIESTTPVYVRVENCVESLQQAARHWRRQLNLRVVGITGSVGKSTTKEVVAEVLMQRYRTFKTSGNLNNEIGLPLMLLSLSEGHERAVLEMGFYVPGEIALLCDLAKPEIGVVTNIGTVHAERAGDQETIARGKAELVEALPPDGVAILNYDDPLVYAMAKQTRARVFTYGLNPEADLWADQVEGLGLEGIHFRLHHQGETIHLRVPMIGRHSVQTALRAAAVGLNDGLDWQEIVEGLRSSPTQLRLMAVRAESGALILDDSYNASPESVLAALNLLSELQGRKLAVLGDMLELGPYEEDGHQKVGIRAAACADRLITLGERSRMIAAAAMESGMPRDGVVSMDTAEEIIAYLKKILRPNDVVLVKGSRGMRMERIVSALEVER